MPKKKKLIDKKKAATSHDVHRSQRDPLVADETTPQCVLVPTATDKSSKGKVKEEQMKNGIYFDDDYNYLQHLRDVNKTNVEWVEVPKNSKPEKQELNLPSSVSASGVEEKVGLSNKAAPQSNEKDKTFSKSGSDYAKKMGDEIKSLDGFEKKSMFTDYSLSSSVISRNSQLTLLDKTFEQVFGEYGDTEIGALKCEDIEGKLGTDCPTFQKAAEKFEKERQVEKLTTEDVTKLNLNQVDENDNKNDDSVEVKENEKWDCESVLSTYSNLYNHPKLIKEPVQRIKIDEETGIKNPFHVRKGTKMNPSETSVVVLSDSENLRKRMKMNPSETSVVILSDSDSESESEDNKVINIDESVNSEIEVITLDDSNVNQSIVTYTVDTTPDFIPIMNVLYNKPKFGRKRRFDASPDITVSKEHNKLIRGRKRRLDASPGITVSKEPKRGKKRPFDASPDVTSSKERKRLTEQIISFAEKNIKPCNQYECTNKKSTAICKSKKKVITEIQPKSDDKSEYDSNKPRIPQIQLSHTNIHNTIAIPYQAGGLRPIIIDGCNVAFGFGNGKFLIEGIIFVVEYFKKRGHEEIVTFLPQCYRNKLRPEDIDKQIKEYEKENIITYTPSRYLNGKLIKPYDDRFIVQYASEREGVIISNDGYLDLINEESSWRITIEQRIINFTFARGLLMLPKDPLGPNGPTLDEMLKFPFT